MQGGLSRSDNPSLAKAYARIKLSVAGVSEDKSDWAQLYFCLRAGFYKEAVQVGKAIHIDLTFAP